MGIFVNMKKHFFPIIFIVSVLGATGYLLLNTPFVLSKIIPRFADEYLKEINLKSFKIRKQQFSFPDTVELYDVEFVVEKGEKVYAFSAHQIVLHEILRSWKDEKQIRASLKGVRYENNHVAVKEFVVKLLCGFKEGAFFRLEGIFRGEDVSVLGYELQEVSGNVKMNRQRIQVSGLTGKGYGGDIQGQVHVELSPRVGYVVWLEFFDTMTEKLVSIQKDFFEGFEGTVDGTLRLIGGREKVDLFDVILEMPYGGFVYPQMVSAIAREVQDKDLKNRLEAVAYKEEKVPAGKVSFHLRNIQDSRLTMFVNLESKKEDIRIKETIEFVISDGLLHFLMGKTPGVPAPSSSSWMSDAGI